MKQSHRKDIIMELENQISKLEKLTSKEVSCI